MVDDLLESLSTKFASVSGDIYQKLEEMGKRLDAMEANLEAASTRSSGKKA